MEMQELEDMIKQLLVELEVSDSELEQDKPTHHSQTPTQGIYNLKTTLRIG